MKNICAVLALASTASIASANDIEYDDNARSLLVNVFKYCPIEFIQGMKDANQVSKATLSIPRPADSSAPEVQTYTLSFTGGGLAPSFETWDMGQLKITRTEILARNRPSDAPTRWKTECLLETHKPTQK